MHIKIVKDTNKIMRKRSEPVALPLSKEDKEALDSMLDYLKLSQDDEYAKKHNIRAGCGLAAVQIGLLKRMFTIYYTQEDNTVIQYELVNPIILESSVKKIALHGGEGCLSVSKDYQGYTPRSFKIKMKAYDALQEKEIIIYAKGYDAIVLQHEYDHLNGILFYDNLVTNPQENNIQLI